MLYGTISAQPLHRSAIVCLQHLILAVTLDSDYRLQHRHH